MHIFQNKFRVHRDVLLFLSIVAIVGAVGVITVGIQLDDIRTLFFSGRMMVWIGVTALSAGLVFVLLYGRRQLMIERTTLKTFLDGAGDGIFAIDRAFNITLWNPMAEKTSGIPKEEAIGKPMRDVVRLFRERDRKEDLVFIEEAMLYNEQRTMAEPMYLLRKDGTEVSVADSAAPLRDASGHAIGCVIILRNTTTDKQKQAMHSEFAYASHQLRTPVTKALWSLEAAREKEQPDKEDIELAYAALRSIRKLVSEIVDVSELDQEMVHPRPSELVIKDVVDEVLDELEYELEAQNITVDASDVADSVVWADARMFRRVLGEVLNNAVLYSREGGSVHVGAQQTIGRVIISVTNTGIGIPDEEAAMIFTKFFRGSNFDTTAIAGAGLGLNIAKGYVELMDGRIWFTGEQNKGCSFFVQLPTAKPSS